MSKERKALSWEGNDEEVRRLFTLTPDDLYFLRPLRVDSQRLYRALVLLWARVERVLRITRPQAFQKTLLNM